MQIRTDLLINIDERKEEDKLFGFCRPEKPFPIYLLVASTNLSGFPARPKSSMLKQHAQSRAAWDPCRGVAKPLSWQAAHLCESGKSNRV